MKPHDAALRGIRFQRYVICCRAGAQDFNSVAILEDEKSKFSYQPPLNITVAPVCAC